MQSVAVEPGGADHSHGMLRGARLLELVRFKIVYLFLCGACLYNAMMIKLSSGCDSRGCGLWIIYLWTQVTITITGKIFASLWRERRHCRPHGSNYIQSCGSCLLANLISMGMGVVTVWIFSGAIACISFQVKKRLCKAVWRDRGAFFRTPFSSDNCSNLLIKWVIGSRRAAGASGWSAWGPSKSSTNVTKLAIWWRDRKNHPNDAISSCKDMNDARAMHPGDAHKKAPRWTRATPKGKPELAW